MDPTEKRPLKTKLRRTLLALLATTAVSGCNQPPTGSAGGSDPLSPALAADDNTWGSYLAEQGKIHGKDVALRPYIFLVPDGDTPEAISRRRELAKYIASTVGPVILPGSLVIIGGRSSHDTTTFTRDMAELTPKSALKGIVILIVSDGKNDEAISKSFAESQGTIRFSRMLQK